MKCSDLPYKVTCASVVADIKKNKVYASANNSISLNDGPFYIFSYDLNSHQWKELPKTGYNRCVLLLCNGQLNAIGGYDKSQQLSKNVLTFSEITNNWVFMYPDMHKSRLRPGAIAYQDHMIVGGGHISLNNDVADDIEILDCMHWPFLWKICPVRLPKQMWAINFAVCEGYVFIVGYNHADSTSKNAYSMHFSFLKPSENATRFDDPSYYWVPLPNAPYGRAGLTSTSTHLVIAGGSKSSKLTSDVFSFNIYQNTWKKIGTLTSPRASATICTINDSTIMLVGGYSRGGSIEASYESALATVEMGRLS